MTQIESAPAPDSPHPDRASEPPARTPRWRRWTAGTLIVISCVLAPISVISVWLRNELLSTDRYVANVTPLASDPVIINTVATDITNALFDQVNVEQAAKNALPPKAGFLADPLVSALHDVVLRSATAVLSSDKFQTAWVTANRLAHEQLRKALTNEGKVLSNENGKVVLDLSSLAAQVRAALQEHGVSVFDRIPADRLNLRFELMDAKQLDSAQRAVRLLDQLSWALPIAALVCLGGGLALSSNRRRSLLRWGIGSALALAVIGASIQLARTLYLNAVTSPSLPRDAAAAVFDTLVRFLHDGVRLFIVIGLVVALAAWLWGPSGLAAKLRATARSTVGQAGDATGSRGVGFGAFGAWVSLHRGQLRIACLLLVLLILLLWDHPRGVTVIALGILFLVLIGVVEFVARASSAEHATSNST